MKPQQAPAPATTATATATATAAHRRRPLTRSFAAAHNAAAGSLSSSSGNHSSLQAISIHHHHHRDTRVVGNRVERRSSRSSSSKARRKNNADLERKEEGNDHHPILSSSTSLFSSSTSSSSSTPSSNSTILFRLNDETNKDLVKALLVCRPSKRNKSPYVADIYVPSLQREALCHVPNLDMGGKCRAGVTLLVKPARHPRTQEKVGPDAVNPTHGTPKCEFILQLLFVDESSLGLQLQRLSSPSSSSSCSLLYPPTWVGAHPSLGERIAQEWLRNGVLDAHMPSPIVKVQSQVVIASPESSSHVDADTKHKSQHEQKEKKSRFDFLVTHQDGSKRIVEVKTVVDCDYASFAPPPPDSPIKCRYVTHHVKEEGENNHIISSYRRTALFPWGSRKQKGPNGEAVVSSRAIEHVQRLTQLVVQQQPSLSSNHTKTTDWEESENNAGCMNINIHAATLLFVVVRGDAHAFRPNHEACPSFVQALREAHKAGVQVLAKRVRWGDHNNGSSGDCVIGGAAAGHPTTTTSCTMERKRKIPSSRDEQHIQLEERTEQQHRDATTIKLGDCDLGVCYSDIDLPIIWPTCETV